jgi:hypothetical protein
MLESFLHISALLLLLPKVVMILRSFLYFWVHVLVPAQFHLHVWFPDGPLHTSVMGSRFLAPYTELICSGSVSDFVTMSEPLDQGAKG